MMGRFAPINSALLLPALFIQIPLLPLASSKAPRRRAAWRRSLELGPLSFSCCLFSSSRRFSSSTSLRRSSSAFFRAACLACSAFCFFSSIAACWASAMTVACFSATSFGTFPFSMMFFAMLATLVSGLLSSEREVSSSVSLLSWKDSFASIISFTCSGCSSSSILGDASTVTC